jgi:hypothetical protein
MNNKHLSSLAMTLLLAVSWVGAGPTFRIDGSAETARQHPGNLSEELRSLAGGTDGAIWVAWTVPIIEGDYDLCCYPIDEDHRSRRGCSLDGGSFSISQDDESDRQMGATERRLAVLVRMDGRRVDSLRVFGDDCDLQEPKQALFVLDTVGGGESVAFLTSLVETGDADLAENALAALAFHAWPGADGALKRFTTLEFPEETREHSMFWLAVSRGDQALPVLDRVLSQDPSPEVREQAVFALSMLESQEATERLLRLARESETADIRSTALFWLGQRAGERIVDAIGDAIRDDPDIEVKEAAVFALSQLPPDEGVPILLRVAKTHRHPEVRRQAMFWLGESGDPRALGFFEQVLND